MELLVGGGQTATAEATPKKAVASASSRSSAVAGPFVVEEPESAEGLGGILVVSPCPEDCACLHGIFESQRWKLQDARTYREAMAVLCWERMPVVICESRLPDGNWKDILSQIAPLADAPRIIVTSLHEETDLRSEVLKMGGYGVLSKPFERNETLRLVDGARQDWQKERNQSYQMGRALRMTA